MDAENHNLDYYNSLSEKELRKAFRLPVTKQLVHYKSRWTGEKENVISFKVVSLYETPGRATLEITVEDGRTICIHSKYFESMQKPSFIDDMRKSDISVDVSSDEYAKTEIEGYEQWKAAQENGAEV